MRLLAVIGEFEAPKYEIEQIGRDLCRWALFSKRSDEEDDVRHDLVCLTFFCVT